MNRSSRRKTLSHSEIENFLNEISNVNKDQVVNEMMKVQDKENILNSNQQQDNKDPLNLNSISTKSQVIPVDTTINLEEQSIREFCKLTFGKRHPNETLESSSDLCTIGRSILNITNYPIISRRLLKPELYLHASSSLEAKKTLLLALSPMLSEAEEERVKETTACEIFTRCKSSKGKSKYSFFDYIDTDTQSKVSYSEYEKRYLMYIAQNKKTYKIKLHKQINTSINYLTAKPNKSNHISQDNIFTLKNTTTITTTPTTRNTTITSNSNPITSNSNTSNSNTSNSSASNSSTVTTDIVSLTSPTVTVVNVSKLSPVTIIHSSSIEKKFTIPKGIYQYSHNNQDNKSTSSTMTSFQVINNNQPINQSICLFDMKENNNPDVNGYQQDNTLNLLSSITNNSNKSIDIDMTSEPSDIDILLCNNNNNITYNNNSNNNNYNNNNNSNNNNNIQDRKRKHSKQPIITSRRGTLSPETARSMMIEACSMTDDNINLIVPYLSPDNNLSSTISNNHKISNNNNNSKDERLVGCTSSNSKGVSCDRMNVETNFSLNELIFNEDESELIDSNETQHISMDLVVADDDSIIAMTEDSITNSSYCIDMRTNINADDGSNTSSDEVDNNQSRASSPLQKVQRSEYNVCSITNENNVLQKQHISSDHIEMKSSIMIEENINTTFIHEDINPNDMNIEVLENVMNPPPTTTTIPSNDDDDLDIKMIKSFGDELDLLLCDDIILSCSTASDTTASNTNTSSMKETIQVVQDSQSIASMTGICTIIDVSEYQSIKAPSLSEVDLSYDLVIEAVRSEDSLMNDANISSSQVLNCDMEILNNVTIEESTQSQIGCNTTQIISENVRDISTMNIINEYHNDNVVVSDWCKSSLETVPSHTYVMNDIIIEDHANKQQQEEEEEDVDQQQLPLVPTLCYFNNNLDDTSMMLVLNTKVNHIETTATYTDNNHDNATSAAMLLSVDISSPLIKSKSTVLVSSPSISLMITKPPSPPTSIPSFINPSPLQKRIGSSNKYHTNYTTNSSPHISSSIPIESNSFDILNSIRTPLKSFQITKYNNDEGSFQVEDINNNESNSLSLVQCEDIKIITMNEDQYDSPTTTSYCNKSMDEGSPNSLVDFYRKQIIPEEIMDSDLETFEILESMVEKEYLNGMICQWGEYQTYNNSHTIDTYTTATTCYDNSYTDTITSSRKEQSCNNISIVETLIRNDTTNIIYITEQKCDNSLQSNDDMLPPSIDMKLLEEQAELRLKYRTETAYWQYKWEIVSGHLVNKIIQNKINQSENNNS